MIEREFSLPPKSEYPIDQWRFVQKKLNKHLLGQDEALFATSNGYIGIRGNFEEGEPISSFGTYLAGFYESWPIKYSEEAYGFAKTGQTMLNVTNAHQIKLFVDDEPFSLRHAHTLDFERALDFKRGSLTRTVTWETAASKQVKIESERIVSFKQRHLVAIKYKVTVLNASAYLAFDSKMYCEEPSDTNEGDPRKGGKILHKVFQPKSQVVSNDRIKLGHSTRNSKLQLVCAADHSIETKNKWTSKSTCERNTGKTVITVEAKKNEPVTIYKFISYQSSSPFSTVEELSDRADRTLDRAMEMGFEKISKQQRRYLKSFWEGADIVIGGLPRINQYVRLNIFHLLQSSARVQNSGIGAKGLTGPGYEGHCFWDIEIYMMPFLIYNLPTVAKNLLVYRFNMLDIARERAQELSHKGALFPWRTINGHEASAFFPAGTAQYHINADIAYAIQKYVEVTGDQSFVEKYGAEILIETARLWEDLGFFNGDNKFHINGVTGPDEYNAIVNNNTFTNLMAKNNLLFAAKTIKTLNEQKPEIYKSIAKRLKLEEIEIKNWEKAGRNMYIPYSEQHGINPQDDGFLHKEVLDLNKIPKEKFPLLLHYHPLTLYRYQVIKQADIVLAQLLLESEFGKRIAKKNFDYYDPLTTGDSSLSVSVQGIMAARLGYLDLASKYFNYALVMDIADIGDNIDHGIHLASMGGIWMAVVYGIAGMRDRNGEISFWPRLVGEIESVSFKLSLKQIVLGINIEASKTTYTLIRGDQFSFSHKRIEIRLKKGKSKSVK